MPVFIFDIIQLPFPWTIIIIIPTYIDGAVQAFLNIESTNSRRFMTGILSGIGTMSLASKLGIYIANQILLLIN